VKSGSYTTMTIAKAIAAEIYFSCRIWTVTTLAVAPPKTRIPSQPKPSPTA
jgi:hypothetical protein